MAKNPIVSFGGHLQSLGGKLGKELEKYGTTIPDFLAFLAASENEQVISELAKHAERMPKQAEAAKVVPEKPRLSMSDLRLVSTFHIPAIDQPSGNAFTLHSQDEKFPFGWSKLSVALAPSSSTQPVRIRGYNSHAEIHAILTMLGGEKTVSETHVFTPHQILYLVLEQEKGVYRPLAPDENNRFFVLAEDGSLAIVTLRRGKQYWGHCWKVDSDPVGDNVWGRIFLKT